ncbi:hypothetical protein ARMSODRAFT_973702 [Armillaria solidipes]|uniref:Uncharacterized protein n=1 Tax=Armillaria solidipes TaxID=1076256 RepID=A0A2H3BW88_9AGAR|nr:hypothetical protein ARMSODRAFT_973702 [Armillaria solidipes]
MMGTKVAKSSMISSAEIQTQMGDVLLIPSEFCIWKPEVESEFKDRGYSQKKPEFYPSHAKNDLGRNQCENYDPYVEGDNVEYGPPGKPHNCDGSNEVATSTAPTKRVLKTLAMDQHYPGKSRYWLHYERPRAMKKVCASVKLDVRPAKVRRNELRTRKMRKDRCTMTRGDDGRHGTKRPCKIGEIIGDQASCEHEEVYKCRTEILINFWFVKTADESLQKIPF